MFSSLKISKFISALPVRATNSFSTSSVQCKRMGKRVRNVPEWKRLKLAEGPWWKKDPIVMRAPLARTEHPVSQFSKLEEDIQVSVAAQSALDLPQDMSDPYAAPAQMCVLCPRRYAPGHSPQPSYLNPKLLSQFTSPHTGKLYDRHITGLCAKMQAQVEKEILRSQQAGLMSTKVKALDYLQDHQLVNASKPHMPNPY